MRALEAEVVDAVWAATEPLLPPRPEHPLGCHRPRVPDRLCLWALLIRLTTTDVWAKPGPRPFGSYRTMESVAVSKKYVTSSPGSFIANVEVPGASGLPPVLS